ncbi:UbiA prenyltransferase [Lentinula lateritia]|nr:UbiA prenyltransferase [Lentinula lateritia]
MRQYFELTRLHKFPLGTLVVFWPAAFGVGMASYALCIPLHTMIHRILVFGLGITISHAAFCIWNDICDRDLDAKVERTKTRPLVTGAIKLHGAVIFFLVILFTLFGVTACASLHSNAITMGLLGMPLHFIYPFMKRWTWWPQAWLGLSNGTTFLVGWFSVAGSQSSGNYAGVLVAMYFAVTCWTIYYDTVYAAQDKDDDARAGVKSTALLFGEMIRFICSCFATLMIVSLIIAGVMNKHGSAYFVVSCGGAAAHLLWQLQTWNIQDTDQAGSIFKENGNTGLIVFSGMAIDYIINHKE